MSGAATQALLRLHDEHYELEDYQSGVPRWCTGCGDNAILAAVQRLCRDEDLAPERTVFISGIGCSSRFPHYMKTVRAARHPRPRAADRRGGQDRAARSRGVRQHRRRRLLQHRRGALDPRHPLQHEPHGHAARQPDLRPDQEAGLADLADRAEEQHHAVRLLPRGAQSADGDARGAERFLRCAGGRTGFRRCSTT